MDQPNEQSQDNKPIIILVLGILGFLPGCCLFGGPLAWFLGSNYRKECIMEGTEPPTPAVVGRIMGIIGSIVTGLLILLNCVWWTLSMLVF